MNKAKSKLELVAPAGNLKKLKYAIEFGADAVYCGIPVFSLRTRVNEFSLKILKQGIEHVHSCGKKVYVTLNIFPHEEHLVELAKHVRWLRAAKPDALIVSDPGALAVVKKNWPTVKIHLSTQANCINSEAVKFWAKQGVKRIILARETTLAEIKKIHKAAPRVELEYFVHGAMCVAYSGRCLLSQLFTDRSANLGDCTQPCRWEYNLQMSEVLRPDQVLDVEQYASGTYLMNSRDLCLVEYLEDLKKAGVTSFKIEGRAKSIYYVAGVTKVYRDAIDNIALREPQCDKRDIEELQKYQNRGFTTGFLFGKEKCPSLRGASAWQGQKIDESHEICEWEFCGEVIATSTTMIKVSVHNQIFVGDTVEFVSPCGGIVRQKILKMYDEKMAEISEAHGGQKQVIYIETKKNVPEMTLLRRKII